MSKKLEKFSKQPNNNLVDLFLLNDNNISFDEFLEILKDERFGGKDLRAQYNTYLANREKGSVRAKNALEGLKKKYETFKTKTVSIEEKPTARARPAVKEGVPFDYNLLSEEQKKRFDGFVDKVVSQVKENRKEGSKVRNPFSLKGQNVNQGGTAAPGTRYNQADIFKEAQKKLLAENNAKIASTIDVVKLNEEIQNVIDSDFDEETKKEQIEDILDKVKKKTDERKKDVEAKLTPREIADLESSEFSQNFSLSSLLGLAASAPFLRVKGDDVPVASIVSQIMEKIKPIFKDSKSQKLIASGLALLSAVPSELYENPSISEGIKIVATNPKLLTRGYEFAGAAMAMPGRTVSIALVGALSGLIYYYSDDIRDFLTDTAGKIYASISYITGWNTSEITEYAEQAIAEISNQTVSEFKNSEAGMIFNNITSGINDSAVVALVNSSEIANDVKNITDMVNVSVDSIAKPLALSNVSSTNLDGLPTFDYNTYNFLADSSFKAPGILAPSQKANIAKPLEELNNIKPLLALSAPPSTEEINNNYSINSTSNIMSFQPPYKTYEDLPEYLRVFISPDEFKANMANIGNINNLINRGMRSYVDNKNSLLASNLPKVPRDKIPVRMEGKLLSQFPKNVPNSTPSNFIREPMQNMIGTNTRLRTGGRKKFSKVEYEKPKEYDNPELIGSETRLIRKVIKARQ